MIMKNQTFIYFYLFKSKIFIQLIFISRKLLFRGRLLEEKIAKSFNKKNSFYYWFKLKKEAQIISKKQNKDKSLDFINLNFKKIKEPSIKIIFDIANLNKNAEKYKEAIQHYDQIMLKINESHLFILKFYTEEAAVMNE